MANMGHIPAQSRSAGNRGRIGSSRHKSDAIAAIPSRYVANRGCQASSCLAFAFDTRMDVSTATLAAYGATRRVSQRGSRRGGGAPTATAEAVAEDDRLGH